MVERPVSGEAAVRMQAVQRLSGIVEGSFQPPFSLADHASHRTWQHIANFLGERNPEQRRLFTEIDKHNAGNNVVNAYITGEFVGMRLTNKKEGEDFYSEITQWSQDERSIAEKFIDEKYGLIRDVVLESAEFMHNGYAYGSQQYKNTWRKTSPINRRKSFIVALSIADNMFQGITSDLSAPRSIDNTNGDIEKLFGYNLPVTPEQTDAHVIWDSMMDDVLYLYDPNSDVTIVQSEAFLIDRFEEEARVIFGGGATQRQIDDHTRRRRKELGQSRVYDSFEISAMKVQAGWTAVQLTNPLRIATPYDEEEVGRRAKVRIGDVSPTMQSVLWSRLEADGMDITQTYMQQQNLESIEQAQGRVAETLRKQPGEVTPDDYFAELLVETDPRIVPYPFLSKIDKGNNITAIASTYESIRRKYLGKFTQVQEVVDFLSSIVRHGLVNPRGTFDSSNEIIEDLSAGQHAAWAANAFKRDGISADRAFQAKLYRDLPHSRMQGVNKDWQDEQQYDREAVVRSCAVLLAAFTEQCQDGGLKVTIEEDVQAVLENMELKRVVIDTI